MSDTDPLHVESALATAPLRQSPSLEQARSLRAIDKLLEQIICLGEKPLPSRADIRRRRGQVKRLLVKTRMAVWIWANVYGYGDDDLFPEPLYHPDAAYLAVVQAGVILLLDSARQRIACFESDDGCVWNRHGIRHRSPLTNPSLYA